MAFIELRYEHNFSKQLNAKARIYYDRYYYHGDYIQDWAAPGNPPFLVTNKDKSMSDAMGGSYSSQKPYSQTIE